MNKKQDVILKYIRQGKSQRQISKETGICRKTIRKYIKNYEDKLLKVNENLDAVGITDIIDDITSKPRYTSSSRSKRVLTDDVINPISEFLKENEQETLNRFI